MFRNNDLAFDGNHGDCDGNYDNCNRNYEHCNGNYKDSDGNYEHCNGNYEDCDGNYDNCVHQQKTQTRLQVDSHGVGNDRFSYNDTFGDIKFKVSMICMDTK